MKEEQITELRKKYFIYLTGVDNPRQISEREKVIINKSFDFLQQEIEARESIIQAADEVVYASNIEVLYDFLSDAPNENIASRVLNDAVKKYNSLKEKNK